MQYRKLGNTGSSVSSLCLGTMTFGHEADEAAAHAILDAYVAAGGNFIDTADVYSSGKSEEIIGRWLKAHPTEARQVVIATKGRFPMGRDPTTSASPVAISAAPWMTRSPGSASSRSTSTRCTPGMR
jgi:aryl-alcohol dehydrogenase-like predicted oxidoreductase